MAFTMHSHSGQFCPGHAKNQLEEIVKHAISIGYKKMGLTEHIPRIQVSDLYPEEMNDPEASLTAMRPLFDAYIVEAQRLQFKYANQIDIVIGFESEYIRPEYTQLVQELASRPGAEYFIGSLHHTCGIPVDYDKTLYEKAKAASGGTEVRLFAAYYDEQLAMLQALQPRIVGHFDLIRLMSDEPARSFQGWDADEGTVVWDKVKRNLAFIQNYGGWLECNSSALRKGLAEPYPCREIAKEWLRLGGRFTMSDDSHGIAQIATNYHRALDFLDSLGVDEVWTLTREASADGQVSEKAVAIEDFRISLRLPAT